MMTMTTATVPTLPGNHVRHNSGSSSSNDLLSSSLSSSFSSDSSHSVSSSPSHTTTTNFTPTAAPIFPYQTYRYCRSKLVEDNPFDKYDLKKGTGGCPSSSTSSTSIGSTATNQTIFESTTVTATSSSSSSSSSLREYWTNGRTTYLYSIPNATTSVTTKRTNQHSY